MSVSGGIARAGRSGGRSALALEERARGATGIILGSGLGGMADAVSSPVVLPYAEVPGLPGVGARGHDGRFVAGHLDGHPVVLACGRAHAYEGHAAGALGATVRFLAAAGIARLLVTNAAGAVNPEFRPGEWMLLTDHINLLGSSPLEGRADFVDMTAAYDGALREAMAAAAAHARVPLRQGVYAAVRGPQYETPAEVRMLRAFGADAVGMSTVPEVIQARALALPVAGLSCLTNAAAESGGAALSHDEVVTVGRDAAARLPALLRAWLAALPPASAP